jgi:Tol biopolymer transport system component
LKPRQPLPLALALLLVSCRGSEHPRPTSGEPRPGSPVQLTSGTAVEIFPAFSPDGHSIAYSSNETGAFEIYVRAARSGAIPRRITSDGKQNLQPTWSPDGMRIAFHSKDRGGIWVMPTEGGPARPLTDFGTRPSWSPDGDWIAFQVHPVTDLGATSRTSFPPSTIWVVPARGGPARQVTESLKPSGGHGSPVFTADSKRILFTAIDSKVLAGELWSVPLGGGIPKRLFAQPRLFDPAVSRNGQAVYFGDHSPDFHFGLYRMRLSATGEPLHGVELVAQVGQTVARHPTVSPDGRTVVWSALSTAGNIWTLPITRQGEAAGPARPLTHVQARSTWPVFSPSGTSIAFGRSGPGMDPDVWTMDTEGRNPIQLTSSSSSANLIGDWLPDGRRIFFVTNRTKQAALWTIDTITRKEEPLPFSDPDIGIPRISPDATRLAYQTKMGSATINVWIADIRTGMRRQLTFDREFIGFPCWSPDGKSLAVQVSRGDDAQVAVLSSEGGDPVQLTFDRGLSWPFSFSPDGDKIAFAGSRQDRWAIWWVSRSTQKQQRLTPNVPLNAYVRYPDWSPRGDRIVYEYGETTGHLWMVRTGE